MRTDLPVAEVMEIAVSGRPQLERARVLLEELCQWLEVDAIWLTLSDPDSHVYAAVGSTGLEAAVLDYLDPRSATSELRDPGLDEHRPPISVTELPVSRAGQPTWADCSIPAGFAGGLGVPLVGLSGARLGLLSVLFARGEPPSQGVLDGLGRLAPLIARGVSPTRSLSATARLVDGATSGTVLLRNAATSPLLGMADHPFFAPGSPVLELARRSLLAGEVYRSFLWPLPNGRGSAVHARITVLAATDAPAFVLGTLLVAPGVDCRGLTPRELEVLGLIVDGRTNQQIARRLALAPRTVAAHLEHILHKLGTPTRTLAAVEAVRDGCYVPVAPPRRDPPGGSASAPSHRRSAS